MTLRPVAQRLILAVILLALLIPCHSLAESPAPSKKHVLVISSFHRGYVWTQNVLQGIDDAFGRSGLGVEVYDVFLDMKRIPRSKGYFDLTRDQLKVKFDKVKFDAVIASDNDGFEFAQAYRDELFPGIPVVFCAINDFDDAILRGRRDITGVTENTDYAGTIDVALKVCPKTRTVVVVSDDTTTGRAHRSAVDKIAPAYRGRVSFRHLSLGGTTLDGLGRELSKLPSDSVVLLLHHFVDKDGRSYSVQESTPVLTASAPVPTFVVTDIRLGLGAVGGSVISGFHYGQATAEMALRILRGTPVEQVPVLKESPNKLLFDHVAMERFGLSESGLPPGSIVIGSPASLWREYRSQILAVVGAFLLLCALTMKLVVENRIRRKTEADLRHTEEMLRKNQFLLAETEAIGSVGGWNVDVGTGKLTWTEGVYRIYELDPSRTLTVDDAIGFYSPGSRPVIENAFARAVEKGESFELDLELVTAKGNIRHVHAIGHADRENNRVHGFFQDISARKRVEEELLASEARLRQYRDIVERMQTGLYVYHLEDMDDDRSLRLINANPASTDALGLDRGVVVGHRIDEVFPNLRAVGIPGKFADVVRTGAPFESEEFFYGDRNVLQSCFSFKAFPVPGDCVCVLFEDLTRRKHAEAEKANLESQLNQARKLESIGTLAGGVAHDFNNMLGVILGNAEMTLESLDPASPLVENLQEIQKAATRSADITRQLLAFARKQTITPKVVELDEAVESMLKMLRRLIGEDVDIAWTPASHGWKVKIDPSQLDQILANLMTNSRDAISGVGRVSLETSSMTFDERYCAQHPEFSPGEYVCLSVSDTGRGIPKKDLPNIFEPFFTTKEVGKGTGLGLATVYGIVRQNRGFVNVYSEPGQGTTFRIYLPRVREEESGPISVPDANVVGGTETLLLVEDEAANLNLMRRSLASLGYSVLSATDPMDAIRVAERHRDEISLLVTDVVMPGMNGRELAEAVSRIRPGIRHLFVSGYTSSIIAERGVLSGDENFLQKPYTIKALASKVRSALDR